MSRLETAQRDEPIELKPAFAAHYKELLGEDGFATYVEEIRYYLPKAVRINTLKCDPAMVRGRLASYFTLTPIPWCADAYWISGERRDVGNTVEHQLGYLYVQEAASMLPPVVLDPKPGMAVLDIAAAPGSKTTQLAALMQNTGVIVANDQGMRLRPLGINVQKCGCTNVILTNHDGRGLAKKPGFRESFDCVLADVPCSATGTLQRSAKAASMWNPRTLGSLQSLQRSIALSAWQCLRAGGRMVYSTCTLEPAENEAVVSWLATEHGARVLPIELPLAREQPFLSWAGEQYHESVRHCLRIHPQTNHTEGFFVALLEKPPA